MDPRTETYQEPLTIALTWRFMWSAAAIVALQVIPVGYTLVTADAWVPQALDEGGLPLGAEDVGWVRADNLIAGIVLILMAAGMAVVARGAQRGWDWSRILIPAIAILVLVACPGRDLNRLDTDVYISEAPWWMVVVSYAFLAMYPLLVASAVLVLLPSSRRHFIPR